MTPKFHPSAKSRCWLFWPLCADKTRCFNVFSNMQGFILGFVALFCKAEPKVSMPNSLNLRLRRVFSSEAALCQWGNEKLLFSQRWKVKPDCTLFFLLTCAKLGNHALKHHLVFFKITLNLKSGLTRNHSSTGTPFFPLHKVVAKNFEI